MRFSGLNSLFYWREVAALQQLFGAMRFFFTNKYNRRPHRMHSVLHEKKLFSLSPYYSYTYIIEVQMYMLYKNIVCLRDRITRARVS